MHSGPVWARGRCRISPPHFLADCCKRQLNQGSFVLLYFRLSAFSDLYWVCFSVFSCTVLFVSISRVIGCEDRLRNDLYCVEWGVKLYSNQTKPCQFASTWAWQCSGRRVCVCVCVRSSRLVISASRDMQPAARRYCQLAARLNATRQLAAAMLPLAVVTAAACWRKQQHRSLAFKLRLHLNAFSRSVYIFCDLCPRDAV